MTDPADPAAPEWRIVRVELAPDHPLSAATAAFLNDNRPAHGQARAKVWQRLEAYVNDLLRARGVRAPPAEPAPEVAPSVDRPKV